ncbi:alpha/beta hydrolase [Rhodococcus sp. 1R11]|uniref:RBBP9/YdeN family alpha/beta hydrolase n=1 Tax=Rhodococcus sp. 1R11 TaxID=2559614 RepID=UPI001FD664FD|nr:alpha/beta hydrolase [Rhodococcus sp. 1R11]
MTTDVSGPRAIIIHGYSATPLDHWFGWLADRLERSGFQATVPALPTPENPDSIEWTDAVSAAVGETDEATMVVAHSLGCLATLRHLKGLRRPWRLGSLVLVAGFLKPLPALPELDTFIGDGCDVSGIADRVDVLTVLRSDTDAYVPVEFTDGLAEKLGTKARVAPGRGHFLGSDGVCALPEVLDSTIPRHLE